MMEEKFSGTQVVTELDAMRAVYDYLALQLDGRFRLQFPDHEDYINNYVEDLRDDECREHDQAMRWGLAQTVNTMGTTLTTCSINGCENVGNHAFMREFINLIWDARELTGEWLRRQGIVPGQSTN